MPEDNINIETDAEETEGQLAIDVYQDDDNIYILAPIAGTAPTDIDVQITDEVVTIRGERKSGHKATDEMHFVQECYWGPFGRTFVLPIAVNSEKAKAQLKNGLLSIIIPKDVRSKTKSLKIEMG
ncbi:heat-shock protein Hsp20 [Candidatus Berkelbacteria bacterium CG08_land_8_20_14_0_20_39_8]|uniref:Heat-shock protein Hsp20 n=1 Tax=Candidatus Berkelbacteria bacterium CG08_land_8_20_14_0_20_39_8 TaxID=1974511 RepID=A0A2M6YCH6_9BACT|nr:MAG: heat-shock protein Hsp20 [Candidatus Berkelbacteria bacterium CG08_land_8_20_14_0_20_39_8]